MSKRRHNPGKQESDCTRKRRFSSPEKARKQHQRTYGGRIRVYPCPFCGGYHVTFSGTENRAKATKPTRRTPYKRNRNPEDTE